MTVIYSRSGEFIGNADTERSALRCAARVPLGYPGRERYTANVGAVIDRDDMADFTPGMAGRSRAGARRA